MTDPNMTLLSDALEPLLARLTANETDEGAWAEARAAVAHYGVGEDDDAELTLAIECEEREALQAIVGGWSDGTRLMLERDRDVLKRAMKAYRKRLSE